MIAPYFIVTDFVLNAGPVKEQTLHHTIFWLDRNLLTSYIIIVWRDFGYFACRMFSFALVWN